jgi:aspartyl protease family protein
VSKVIHPGRRTGKFMLAGAWLLVMVLLTLYFRGTEEKKRNPNRSIDSLTTASYTEIQLNQNRSGHYLARGHINGVEVTFLLDTGATLVAIPYHLKDRLGLRPGMAISTQTANGRSTSYLTKIDRIELGGIELRDVKAGLASGLTGDQILLGMSFLSEMELLQQGNSLTIRQYH